MQLKAPKHVTFSAPKDKFFRTDLSLSDFLTISKTLTASHVRRSTSLKILSLICNRARRFLAASPSALYRWGINVDRIDRRTALINAQARQIKMASATAPEELDFDDLETDELVDGMRTAAGEATKLLRSIGSPHRLMILCLLMDGEKTVTEISDAIGTRQSLTSQHLTHLRLHGLVQAERRGHFAYYSLKHEAAREIVATLYRHYCADGLSKPTEEQ